MSSESVANGSYPSDESGKVAELLRDDLLDVTALIRNCAASLTVGEPFVCNPESFSLHDSMAATELTDRKMDCCEVPANHYTGVEQDREKYVFPRPPPQGLDDSFSPLPWKHLTPREASYISFQLLGCLQAFLSGVSIAESTFTCLYAHASVIRDMQRRLFGDTPLVEPITAPSPDQYAQFFLFTCVIALVDATDIARNIILNADIYEEEDFFPNTYDIPVYTETAEVPTLLLIDAAMKMSSDAGLDKSLLEASGGYLGFFRCFISICSALSKLSTASIRSDVEKIQKECHQALRSLDELERAIKRAGFEDDEAIQRLHQQAFDVYVNRPLVGNTPVRKPVSRSNLEVIQALRTVTNEFDWAVCELLLRGTSLARVRRILDRVQRSNVNVLSRSLIILNLFFDEMLLGQHRLDSFIVNDLWCGRELPESFTGFELTLAFIDRLAKPIYDSLKLRILNPCRQRNFIELVMINDWISLQTEGHVIDIHYREHVQAPKGSLPPFLTQYVIMNLLKIMDRHLAVGFELQIYRSHLDVSMAFWYRDFILSALLNNLSGMRAPLGTDPQKPKASAAKKNAKGKPRPDGCSRPEQVEDDFEMMLLSAQRDLCRGIKRFLVALQQAGVVRLQGYRFTSPERIFEERFAAFVHIPQPPPLSYGDFVEGCDYSEVEPQDLLATTSKCFVSAKAAVDQMLQDVRQIDPAHAPLQEAELRALLKVCVGNNVYLLKLKSLVDSSAASTATPLISFEGKSPFCTIKLT